MIIRKHHLLIPHRTSHQFNVSMLPPLRRIYPQRLPRLLRFCRRRQRHLSRPHHRLFLPEPRKSPTTTTTTTNSPQLHLPNRPTLNLTVIRRHPPPPIPQSLPRPPILHIPISDKRRRGGRIASAPPPSILPSSADARAAAVMPDALGVDFAEVGGSSEDEEP